MKRGELYRVYRGNIMTDFVGALSDTKMDEVNTALRIALAV